MGVLGQLLSQHWFFKKNSKGLLFAYTIRILVKAKYSVSQKSRYFYGIYPMSLTSLLRMAILEDLQLDIAYIS